MRVLHFYKTYWPDTFGGAERTINSIAKHSRHLGAEHQVLSLSNNPSKRSRTFNGQTLHQANRLLAVASTDISVDGITKFRRLARQSDIVHLHFPWPFMDPVYLAFARKIPAVLTYHSDAIGSRFLETVYAPLQHRLLLQVEIIAPTSPNYLETSPVLQKYLNKTTVIPLGIDASAYPTTTSTKRDELLGRFPEHFFLFTGVLRHYKGLDNLLHAASKTEAHIVIVGSGKREAELLALKDSLQLTNVHFAGAVDEAEKVALLETCTGFVFPSNKRSEAFGLSLVEAAMMGKPMISCEIGTGTSFINLDGVTGFVVPPNDPDALANAMNKLVADSGMQMAFGKAARQRYERLFRAETMGQRYFDLYKQVLHETPR